MQLEKVYDELISMIEDLKNNPSGSSDLSISFVTSLPATLEDDVIYAVKRGSEVVSIVMKNGTNVEYLKGSAPVEEYYFIDEADVIQPLVLSEDGTTSFNDLTGVLLKSGGGTFTSYVHTQQPVSIRGFDLLHIEAVYQSVAKEYAAELDTSEIGSTYVYLGFYYKTTTSGNEVGYMYADYRKPQVWTYVKLEDSTSSSGVVSLFTMNLQNA